MIVYVDATLRFLQHSTLLLRKVRKILIHSSECCLLSKTWDAKMARTFHNIILQCGRSYKYKIANTVFVTNTRD